MSTYYSCVGLPDGANPIPGQTILTQYIMCQGDRTIDVKGCPNGKTYDPVKRICTETTQQGKINLRILIVARALYVFVCVCVCVVSPITFLLSGSMKLIQRRINIDATSLRLYNVVLTSI